MKSNDPSEPLDLEQGLKTTERDVEALRALRQRKRPRPRTNASSRSNHSGGQAARLLLGRE